MNPFIQFLIVFDLICFGVYFGGDIICTALAKVRKKTDEEEFELYKVEDDTDASKPALSIVICAPASAAIAANLVCTFSYTGGLTYCRSIHWDTREPSATVRRMARTRRPADRTVLKKPLLNPRTVK